jgi:hypothetical protein
LNIQLPTSNLEPKENKLSLDVERWTFMPIKSVSPYKPLMKGAIYASQQTARKKNSDTALSGQA